MVKITWWGSFIQQVQSNTSSIQSTGRAGDRLGPWRMVGRLEGSGTRWAGALPARADRRRAPKHIHFQAANLSASKKNYSSRLVPICQKRTCHLRKKQKPKNKTKQTTLMLTDRSVFWRKALCFYLIRATALSGKTALSSTCFINSQLFILLLPGKMTNIFPFTHCSPFHSSDKYRTYFI